MIEIDLLCNDVFTDLDSMRIKSFAPDPESGIFNDAGYLWYHRQPRKDIRDWFKECDIELSYRFVRIFTEIGTQVTATRSLTMLFDDNETALLFKMKFL